MKGAADQTAAPVVVDDNDDEDDCMIIEHDGANDCIVIDDDDDDDEEEEASKSTAETSLLSQRCNGRRRKFDDDIVEITDEPPVAKRKKTGNAAWAKSMPMTIQRSCRMAVDPLAGTEHQHQQPQQQQFNEKCLSKKEPTLVIIDINKLMAGRPAVAIQAQRKSMPTSTAGSSTAAVYPNNLRTTITPVSTATITRSSHQPQHHHNSAAYATITETILLPGGSTLTSTNSRTTNTTDNNLPTISDDMILLETPSFIVPYIYKKPPCDNLRDIVERIGRDLADQKNLGDTEVAEIDANELANLALAADNNKKISAANREKPKSIDESWDESDTSTADESSDSEQCVSWSVGPEDSVVAGEESTTATPSPSPLRRFFIDIGVSLVQEYVQTDLLRQHKKKLHREGDARPSVKLAIRSLTKNILQSKEKNEIFKFETKQCEFCDFQAESALAMAHHYEVPHTNGQIYWCNFCAFESRTPYDICFHMEAMHSVKARIETDQTYHQCRNCPYASNKKTKLARHAATCEKKFRPELNLNPPIAFDSTAKMAQIVVRDLIVQKHMEGYTNKSISLALNRKPQHISRVLRKWRERGTTASKVRAKFKFKFVNERARLDSQPNDRSLARKLGIGREPLRKMLKVELL